MKEAEDYIKNYNLIFDYVRGFLKSSVKTELFLMKKNKTSDKSFDDMIKAGEFSKVKSSIKKLFRDRRDI